MASVKVEASSLLAHDIAAYSDAELDRYLEENGRSVLFLAITLGLSDLHQVQICRR